MDSTNTLRVIKNRFFSKKFIPEFFIIKNLSFKIKFDPLTPKIYFLGKKYLWKAFSLKNANATLVHTNESIFWNRILRHHLKKNVFLVFSSYNVGLLHKIFIFDLFVDLKKDSVKSAWCFQLLWEGWLSDKFYVFFHF